MINIALTGDFVSDLEGDGVSKESNCNEQNGIPSSPKQVYCQIPGVGHLSKTIAGSGNKSNLPNTYSDSKFECSYDYLYDHIKTTSDKEVKMRHKK